MSNLNSCIKKYFRHNSKKRFDKLMNELYKAEMPRDKLEMICRSKHVRNMYHLGMLYLAGDRLLLACYYFQLYLKTNREDLEAWIKLQYAAAKRGDLILSLQALQEISHLGNEQDKYRAIAIHNMASGHILSALKAAYFLTSHQNYNAFTAMILFEVALINEDWFVIRWLISNKIGKQILSKSNNNYVFSIKRTCIQRLVYLLKENNGELKNV